MWEFNSIHLTIKVLYHWKQVNKNWQHVTIFVLKKNWQNMFTMNKIDIKRKNRCASISLHWYKTLVIWSYWYLKHYFEQWRNNNKTKIDWSYLNLYLYNFKDVFMWIYFAFHVVQWNTSLVELFLYAEGIRSSCSTVAFLCTPSSKRNHPDSKHTLKQHPNIANMFIFQKNQIQIKITNG